MDFTGGMKDKIEGSAINLLALPTLGTLTPIFIFVFTSMAQTVEEFTPLSLDTSEPSLDIVYLYTGLANVASMIPKIRLPGPLGYLLGPVDLGVILTIAGNTIATLKSQNG